MSVPARRRAATFPTEPQAIRAHRPPAQSASGRAALRPALAMPSSSRNLSGRRTVKVHYHDRVSRAQTNIAVLAEKPSVARDIAHVLGASTKGDGFLHGNG